MSINEELSCSAMDVLHTMIDLLKLDSEISVEENEHGFKLNVATNNAGRLIGRKGQTLESLELLLNRIMKCRNEENPWIPVEVDGYSTGRTGDVQAAKFGNIDVARFQSLALDAAKEVKRWGEEKKLGPYLPGERKAIHMALQDDPEVETESIPADVPKMKYVIVKRKNA